LLTAIATSDAARPLSFKTKTYTTCFFKKKTGQVKTKTALFKDHQIIKQDLKNVTLQKKSGQLCRFCTVMPELCR